MSSRSLVVTDLSHMGRPELYWPTWDAHFRDLQFWKKIEQDCRSKQKPEMESGQGRLWLMERPTWLHLHVTLFFQDICWYFCKYTHCISPPPVSINAISRSFFPWLMFFISNLCSPAQFFLAIGLCIFLRKNACVNISIPIQNLENVCLIWKLVFDLFLISLSVGLTWDLTWLERDVYEPLSCVYTCYQKSYLSAYAWWLCNEASGARKWQENYVGLLPFDIVHDTKDSLLMFECNLKVETCWCRILLKTERDGLILDLPVQWHFYFYTKKIVYLVWTYECAGVYSVHMHTA